MAKVKRAVITAAGLGTRFLPATKNLPKEMLPVVDMPIIHYIVEECIEAGIDDIIIVTRPGNEAVMNYFTPNKALEDFLEKNGKADQLKHYKSLMGRANFIFVNQKADLPYGNGSPILTVKNLVDSGPFVVCFGDDLVLAPGVGAVKQVVDVFEKHEDIGGVIGVTQVSKEEVRKYGIVEIEGGGVEGRVKRIIEKPEPDQVTSNLAEFGRIVLSPEIFAYLDKDKTGKGGELWLMDAIDRLLQQKAFYAKLIDGEFLTTGDPLRYLKASLKFALARDDLQEPLTEFLKGLV